MMLYNTTGNRVSRGSNSQKIRRWNADTDRLRARPRRFAQEGEARSCRPIGRNTAGSRGHRRTWGIVIRARAFEDGLLHVLNPVQRQVWEQRLDIGHRDVRVAVDQRGGSARTGMVL